MTSPITRLVLIQKFIGGEISIELLKNYLLHLEGFLKISNANQRTLPHLVALSTSVEMLSSWEIASLANIVAGSFFRSYKVSITPAYDPFTLPHEPITHHMIRLSNIAFTTVFEISHIGIRYTESAHDSVYLISLAAETLTM
eukprot:sb/3474144/